MKIRRNCTVKGASRPLMSVDKKNELMHLMQQLRHLLGKQIDKEAHTVQIVFTSDEHESVVTIY